MRAAHKKLVEEKGLNDTHFDAIAELLAATLKDLGVGQGLIDEVMTIAGSTRNDVLNKLEKDERSLFERIGGEGAVDAAVDLFYTKVLADERVKDFFT
jgi:truncated hemoglobin YjbI